MRFVACCTEIGPIIRASSILHWSEVIVLPLYSVFGLLHSHPDDLFIMTRWVSNNELGVSPRVSETNAFAVYQG